MWWRPIRSPTSSEIIVPSRRCSAIAFSLVASTSRHTRSVTLLFGSRTGTFTSISVACWSATPRPTARMCGTRPISLIVLNEPLEVLDGKPVSLIELIPPVHQRVYRMGLEHIGVVVGEQVDAFSREHRAALTGQQFQSIGFEPYYCLFSDFTHVKFYRVSLYDGNLLQGKTFDGFQHVDDWEPQRLVTATGPNPLPL